MYQQSTSDLGVEERRIELGQEGRERSVSGIDGA